MERDIGSYFSGAGGGAGNGPPQPPSNSSSSSAAASSSAPALSKEEQDKLTKAQLAKLVPQSSVHCPSGKTLSLDVVCGSLSAGVYPTDDALGRKVAEMLGSLDCNIMKHMTPTTCRLVIELSSLDFQSQAKAREAHIASMVANGAVHVRRVDAIAYLTAAKQRVDIMKARGEWEQSRAAAEKKTQQAYAEKNPRMNNGKGGLMWKDGKGPKGSKGPKDHEDDEGGDGGDKGHAV